MIGVIGKKLGMTRIFSKEGISIPVTAIEVQDNRITQIKNIQSDCYKAIQVTTGIKKLNRLKKPAAGHFIKSGVTVGRGLWEFKITDDKEFQVGEIINI